MPDSKPTHATHPVSDREVLHVEGAVEAPVLFFDEVPAMGFGAGIGRLMLCSLIQDVDAEGNLTTRKKVVAHLRGSGAAFDKLHKAIQTMEALTARPEGPAN
ncbi:hypothetical protein [Methylobacterium trifolii]|uniref:Uncharacterized protein n=1 Tax=Methylobacterium trifolii TaxID=1003092 RepID=A0ABQ4U2U6_9HYPH|nr:hypothetical protein [Methylobacterium trifolii]GJE61308.1 hypothetical protein MPOCJGCO_3429 [Methylobacterium trifolii]